MPSCCEPSVVEVTGVGEETGELVGSDSTTTWRSEQSWLYSPTFLTRRRYYEKLLCLYCSDSYHRNGSIAARDVLHWLQVPETILCILVTHTIVITSPGTKVSLCEDRRSKNAALVLTQQRAKLGFKSIIIQMQGRLFQQSSIPTIRNTLWSDMFTRILEA